MNIKKLNEEIRSLISYIAEDEDKFSTVSESTRKSQYLKEDKSTRLEELLDILSNKNYYKINGDIISIKETNSRLAYLSLWDLADTFKSLGYKVHLSHFYLEVEGLQELIKDRQQKKLEDELQEGDTVVLRGSQSLQLKTKGTYMNINKLNEELQKFLNEENSNGKETYCINLYDVGEGKELDFINRIEGFNSKEEAAEFAKKKYGDTVDIEYQIEKQPE